jgi:hypothetical protein
MSIKLSEPTVTIEDKPIVIKKKKGRPRKILANDDIVIDTTVVQEKKKRGRKKKEKVEEEVKQKKKRGRKAAIKFFSSSIRKKIPLTTIIHDNDNSLLHLDIKETNEIKDVTYDAFNKSTNITQLNSDRRFDSDDDDNDKNDNLLKEDEEVDYILSDYIDTGAGNNIDFENKLTELYEKRLESRLVQDNQLIKKLENLHNDDNLLSKLLEKSNINNSKNTDVDNKIYDKNETFISILSEFQHTDTWIDRTDVACWWCCHTFDTIPIGFPIDYYKKKFRTRGVFCSFGCSIAYAKCNNYYDVKTQSMICSLYKKLTGCITINIKDGYKDVLLQEFNDKNLFNGDLNLQNEYIESLLSFVDTPLEPAPDKCLLKMFGGTLTIDEFRNSTKEKKVYKMIEYPMFVSRDYVEEIDINNLKNVNKNVFTTHNNTNTNNYQKTNKLDDTKLNEVKTRVNSNIVVTNTGMDRFIKW